MAVINRALDNSQQEWEYSAQFGALGTGASNAAVSLPIAMIPYPSTLVAARAAITGSSGSPTISLSIKRFIVGSGTTAYLGGFTTLALQNVGTSGLQSVTIAVAGSTALGLLTGDVIYGSFAGQDSAATSLAVSIVIDATQSVRTHFGL